MKGLVQFWRHLWLRSARASLPGGIAAKGVGLTCIFSVCRDEGLEVPHEPNK